MSFSPPRYRVLRTLNELNTGACEGMTKEEIREKMPLEFEARETDKLAYRYPGGGESYLDVIERVRPLIVELERLRNSVIGKRKNYILRKQCPLFLATFLL
jgi:broad specificity phosphatase PhoE